MYRGLQATLVRQTSPFSSWRDAGDTALLTCTSAHRHQGSSSERVYSGLCADLRPQAAAAQWWGG